MDDSCIEIPLDLIPKIPKKEIIPKTEEKESDPVGSPQSSSGRSSPETNCPICLGKLQNKSFTDSCLHQFCFKCLEEWSKVKAECPLCKQSFKSIIHNVRSIEDYEQYYLSTTPTDARLLGIIARYQPGQQREPFRYRTTAVSSYLDYFVRLEEAISSHVIPSGPNQSIGSHWPRRRQNGTSDFRRNIYQQGLWVQRVADVTGRVRDSSPEFYRANPALVHRLVPWLNRELNVLCSTSEVQNIISRILELITQVPIRSPGFSAAVAPYVGRHTEHFVHEFHSFATSPYDLISYDRYAIYVDRISLAHEIPSDLSDSGNDSDVLVVGPFPGCSNITTTNAPTQSLIQLDSDSDDCIVVDTVVPSRSSAAPEVITLESDDEVVQVNIHIGKDINRPGPSRRPSLKRNWLTVNNVQVPTSSNDNVNVSINIAHGSVSQSSLSDISSSSSSSWTPHRKKMTRTKPKKEKSKRKRIVKGKKLLKFTKKPEVKKIVSSDYSCDDDRSVSPVVNKRRRRPSTVLKSSSSSDDIRNTVHTNTDYSSSSDEAGYKPRLRSVVIKSSVKPEPSSFSPEPPLSTSWSSSNCDEDHLESTGVRGRSFCYESDHLLHPSTFNLDQPECSNRDWFDRCGPSSSCCSRSYSSSPERLPNKRSKHSKKAKY